MFNQRQIGAIFDVESVLSTTYSPSKPSGRESEIEQIVDALQPRTRGQPPENLMVHGPSGSGKSTVVEHVLDRLTKQTNTKSVHLNCLQYNTRASLYCQILIELGYPVPRKGNPVDELLQKLREWLDKNRSVVVALEEFDQLQEQTASVYDLHETSRQASNHLGMILLSNSGPSEIHLDQRSKSRLNYRSIPFEPYTSDELYEILRERSKMAFNRGCVADDALALIAGRVAEKRGDCRHAIELLHRAGRVAARENAEKVMPDHVEQSFNPSRDC